MVVVRKTSGSTRSFSVKNVSISETSLVFIFMTASFSPITRFASTTSWNLEICFRNSRSEPDFTVTKMYASKIFTSLSLIEGLPLAELNFLDSCLFCCCVFLKKASFQQ